MFTINKNSALRQLSCALMILFASIFYTQIYELDPSVALESMGEKYLIICGLLHIDHVISSLFLQGTYVVWLQLCSLLRPVVCWCKCSASKALKCCHFLWYWLHSWYQYNGLSSAYLLRICFCKFQISLDRYCPEHSYCCSWFIQANQKFLWPRVVSLRTQCSTIFCRGWAGAILHHLIS